MTNTLDFEVSVPAEHSALQGFAQRLRELMSERGDTQTELASALGIAQRSVSAYLASEAHPQLGTFVAIGERYGVSLDWLAGLTNAREPRGELVAVVDDDLLRRFLAGEEIAGRIQLTRRIPPRSSCHTSRAR